MGRTIILDGNVFDQINRGNADAAAALQRMVAAGDRIYISQQAYNEVIVNALPRQAMANRIVLERLNIQLAAPGPIAARVEVYANNQTRSGTVVSAADSMVAAQARAIGAEVWSFDRAFRTQGGVTTTLGVRVAPECTSVALVQGTVADYRIGHRLLGLPPVTITVGGQVIRQGPPGSPPGAPGNTNSGGGRDGGSRGGAGGRGGTTATVGVADNALPQVGGPSPRGVAIGAGIQLAFQGANLLLNWLNDREQARRIQEELAKVEPQVNAQRAANPQLGVLLIFYYHQVEAPAESLMRPGAVFDHLETATGRSRDEAVANWHSQPAIRRGAGRNERVFTDERWIPPAQPAGVAALRTPFPAVAVATFSRAKLQDVEWGGVTGFDDEGQTDLNVVGATCEFVVLTPPRVIHWFNGPARFSTDIPLVTRSAASGGTLTLVDLDPWMPGNVSAAMVFPADDATERIFAQGPATHDNLNQLRGYVNIGKMRWVRPEHIRVLRHLSR